MMQRSERRVLLLLAVLGAVGCRAQSLMEMLSECHDRGGASEVHTGPCRFVCANDETGGGQLFQRALPQVECDALR